MKSLKYFLRIILLLMVIVPFYSCIGPVPVDVVMIDNDPYFVLEEKHPINTIQVAVFNPGNRSQRGETVWGLRHDATTGVKKRKYAELSRIRYGQVLDEYPNVVGPLPLKRNVEYIVGIVMGNKFAREVFIVTDDNKVRMPDRNKQGKP